MLIIFSGLPGTGKTTIARELALELRAGLLRIDSLEHALLQSGRVKNNDLGPAGYLAAYALAADNLRLGLTVVADSVNPIAVTRDAWRDVALNCGSDFLEVEVICSDPAEHRHRVETRESDIAGFVLPTWEDVMLRDYQPWTRERLTLDTARLSIPQAVAQVQAALVEKEEA